MSDEFESVLQRLGKADLSNIERQQLAEVLAAGLSRVEKSRREVSQAPLWEAYRQELAENRGNVLAIDRLKTKYRGLGLDIH